MSVQRKELPAADDDLEDDDAANSTELTNTDLIDDSMEKTSRESSLNSEIIDNSLQEEVFGFNFTKKTFQKDQNKNRYEIIDSSASDSDSDNNEINNQEKRRPSDTDSMSRESEAIRKPRRRHNVIDSDASSVSECESSVKDLSLKMENKLKLSSEYINKSSRGEMRKFRQSDLSKVKSEPRESFKYSIDYDDSDTCQKYQYKDNEIIDSSESDNEINSQSLSNIKSKSRRPSKSNTDTKSITENKAPKPQIYVIDSDDSINASEHESSVKNISWEVKNKVKLSSNKNINESSSSGKQTTLDHMLVKSDTKPETSANETIEVSWREYKLKQDGIKRLEDDIANAKEMQKTINLQSLPDKGALLIQREKNLELKLATEREKFSKMTSKDGDIPIKKLLSWEEIKLTADQVQPKTFGKRAINTYTAQKAMTMDTLEHLHKSLAARPLEEATEEEPKGLKVALMLHQKRALKWLLWRETQKPSGGILADDMGLGKTLTMISLMLKSAKNTNDNGSDDETNEHRKKHKYPGGTLVVCPASLLNQWSGEVNSKVNRGRISYYIYHGSKRETSARILADYDLVITTYSLVMNEAEKNGCAFRVYWRRIILDEAHQIRNHKSQTSVGVCKFAAKSRWALTGTPIHNKELDMYALLKFLRCAPFDDLAIWKIWVADKSAGGQERLHTVISSLLLRRTKAELIEQKTLEPLPDRHWELVEVKLGKAEMEVYSKILIFSRTLFAQFLHQRAEKKQLSFDFKSQMGDPNSEFTKMREKLLKFNKAKEVKQLEILVLLLRLRQICCHPCLIIKMLVGKDDLAQEYDGNLDDEDKEEMDLLEMLNKMHLEDNEAPGLENVTPNMQDGREQVCLSDACKKVLNPSDPIFSEQTPSSKIKVIVDVIKSKIAETDDKAIVVSQWTSLLRIVGYHLEQEGIRYDELNGTIPVRDRMEIVNNINNPNHKVKILLLSLTAGGVGLNLVGANHLFFLDLHWNPQLESQAQDRIYRMGQKKPVFIYKFMAVGTIEEQIKKLQERKLEIAETMLSGTRKVISNKLTLTDLRMIFNM